LARGGTAGSPPRGRRGSRARRPRGVPPPRPAHVRRDPGRRRPEHSGGSPEPPGAHRWAAEFPGGAGGPSHAHACAAV